MHSRQESHGTTAQYKAGCRCDSCREARRIYDHERYARLREQRLEQVKTYRAANPEKTRAWSKAQYHRDPAKARAAVVASEAKNPEAVRERARRHSATPHGKLAASIKAQRRRGVVTDEWTDPYIAILLGDPCCYCGGPGGSIDHITAINNGGTSEWDNLTSACKSCNSSKSTFDLLGFLSRKVSAA